MSKDEEIRGVAARLDGLLDQLQDTVAALNAILAPPQDTPEAGRELVPE